VQKEQRPVDRSSTGREKSDKREETERHSQEREKEARDRKPETDLAVFERVRVKIRSTVGRNFLDFSLSNRKRYHQVKRKYREEGEERWR
jgi:hypothetical protein